MLALLTFSSGEITDLQCCAIHLFTECSSSFTVRVENLPYGRVKFPKFVLSDTLALRGTNDCKEPSIMMLFLFQSLCDRQQEQTSE